MDISLRISKVVVDVEDLDAVGPDLARETEPPLLEPDAVDVDERSVR